MARAIGRRAEEFDDSLGRLVRRGLRDFPSESLQQFIDDDQTVVRYWTAQRLLALGTRREFDFALTLAHDGKARRRAMGAFLLHGLAQRKPLFRKQTAPLLQALRADRAATVRAAASGTADVALLWRGKRVPKTAELDRADDTVQLMAFRVMQGLSPLATQRYVDDDHEVVRLEAARRLQWFGTQREFDFALTLTRSPLARRREIGAFILGQLGFAAKSQSRRAAPRPFRRQSVPVLERLWYEDRSVQVRESAIYALGHLAAGSLAVFEEASQHKLRDIRLATAVALGSRRSTRSWRRLLWRLSRDNDAGVRSWAWMWLRFQ